MDKEQILISEFYYPNFIKKLEEHLDKGYRVIPNTLMNWTISNTFNRYAYSVIMEKEKTHE